MTDQQKTELDDIDYGILVNNAPQILWSADKSGEIVYLNPIWYQFSGLTEEESIGHEWINYVHPKDKEVLQKIWRTGVEKNKPFHLEFRLLNKNNTYYWFLCKAIPLIEENEQTSGWVGIFTDIEEQKQILGIVKDKAEEFEVLSDNISHHVWIENANGDPEYMNKTYFEYTGLSPHDVYTDKRFEIFHPDDFDHLKHEWYRNKSAGGNFKYEARMKGKDGVFRWFKIRALPIRDKNNAITKWIGTNTNIHEQKTFEKQKDDFLNIASHELKTPLTTIHGYVQLICKEVDTIQKEKLKLLIQNTSKSINRLKNLVDSLLDISRIESGQFDNIDMENFRIDEFMIDIIKHHQLLNEDRTIELEGKVDVMIRGNKYRLEQVFDNLLSNAVKYSPADKSVSVKLRSATSHVQVSIMDHGNGISNQHMDKVFQRFYSTDDNTLSGLGIGLFISREIIKLHRGNIWVESEVGKGSVFHVELPVLP